jgi:hypothetical protein
MSDPKLQRADGCSVFFSLIIGIILISAYFLFQMFFDDKDMVASKEVILKQRSEKIMMFKKDSKTFEAKIINFHNEKNSSLESAMNKITDSYRSKPSKDQ